jgi:RNA-directed DNA polymerase
MQLIDYLELEKLQEQFKTKLKNSKTIGTDGIKVEKFEKILDDEIKLINRKVRNNTYKFSRYKEKLILKGKNKFPRLIKIPTHRDKLLLNTLNHFLVNKFRDKIIDEAPNQKISKIINDIKSQKYDSFIKLDIENFYSTLNQEILINKITKNIDDEYAINIIKKAINCDNIGIPQGLSISSILSSIYMQEFDEIYNSKENLKYYRYVDDILILCNEEDVEKIKESLLNDIKNLKLTIHPFDNSTDKSFLGNIGKDSFEYLGYRFEGNKISVRKKSIEKLEKTIINIFQKYKNLEEDEFYKKLNLKISGCIYENKQYGWLFYFKLIDDLELLYKLDWFVKKCFKQFKRKYDEKKIKKFIKIYFKLKSLDFDKLNDKSYIPKFEKKIPKLEKKIPKLEKKIPEIDLDDILGYGI